VEQREDVGGQQLDPKGPVDVGGVPVRLQFDGDDLAAGGQPRRVVLHQADGHQRAVDQHQWAAGAPRLVIQLQAVDRGEPRRHVTGAHQPVTRRWTPLTMSPTTISSVPLAAGPCALCVHACLPQGLAVLARRFMVEARYVVRRVTRCGTGLAPTSWWSSICCSSALWWAGSFSPGDGPGSSGRTSPQRYTGHWWSSSALPARSRGWRTTCVGTRDRPGITGDSSRTTWSRCLTRPGSPARSTSPCLRSPSSSPSP